MRLDFGSNIIKDLEKKLGLTSGKTKLRDFSGLKSVPNVDVEKAFQIISQLESGGGYAIGDSGTSFGATQVQLGSFLNGLARDTQTQNITGLSPEQLKELSSEWNKARSAVKTLSLWKPTSVDSDAVAAFARANPRAVVRRREGTTVRFSPETFTIVKLPNQALTLDLDALERIGLNISSPVIRQQLSRIVSEYITDAVVRNAIAKLLTAQSDPATYNRFQNVFSRRSVWNNQQLRDLADRAAQHDFMNKVSHVVNSVQESGYDTNASGAYNIYQLIAISNASGAGRVDQFLRGKKPFGPAHLHYLQRANPLIEKVTGLSTAFPPNGGLSGFRAYASLSKRASFALKFPYQYVEDLRSGKRQMTIRQGDIPVNINQVVRCETYSGGHICDVLITSKELMSTTRIRKAFGQKIADELESKFGPDGRFMVIRFALHENNNDDDYRNNDFGTLDRTNAPQYDGGTIEHVPFGLQMVPVEPGHYHACCEFPLSKQANLIRLESIWRLAESIEDDELNPNDWLAQNDPENTQEDEEDEFSEQWKEKERQRLEELIRQRKEQAKAPTLSPRVEPKSEEKVLEEEKLEEKKLEEKGVDKLKEELEEELEKEVGGLEEEDFEITTKTLVIQPSTGPKKTFEEHTKGIDIPLREEPKKEETREEELEEEDTLSSLIQELEKSDDVDSVIKGLEQQQEEEKEEQKGIKTATNVRLENKKTIYGFRMMPTVDGWHSVPQPPSMTEEARGMFSASNLKTFSSLNKLFSDPKTWNVLNEQPNKQEILQQWVLPALVYNVGKRWFEIYSLRNRIAAFPLFSPEQLDQAIAGQKPLDQTEVGKAYMKQIIIHVTDAANSYFSQASHRSIPVANYINSVVRHKMEREVGFANGFKLRERPICAICKGEEKLGVAVREMIENKVDLEEELISEITPTGKPIKSVLPYSVKEYRDTTGKTKAGKKAVSLYTCENCARKADELMSRDVRQAQNLIQDSEKKNNELNDKLNDARGALLNIQEQVNELGSSPERLTKVEEIQKNIERINRDIQANGLELRDRQENLAHQLQQVRKYKNQVNVPFVHLWCPNQNCPGQRVPLTAVDWSRSDFWKSPDGTKAVEFLRINYGIQYPLEIGQQSAQDTPILNESMVQEIVLSKLPTKQKLQKLFGNRYGEQLNLSQLSEFVTRYDNILKQNTSFRATILKIHRFLQEVPDLRSMLEKAPTQTYHIPPKEMWDVPYICPHDNTKFTIREVMGKGQENESRGGLFYKPYMKAYWYKKGEEEATEERYESTGTKTDQEEEFAYDQLADLARGIFVKKYWDRFEMIERFKRDNPFLAAKPEKLAANPRFQEQLASLKLYDSVREFSADNPQAYVGWLASREFRLTFEQKKNGITAKTSISSAKDTEELLTPILQKWFDSMTLEQNGFEKHGLHTWLVNEKEDGIPSYPVKSETPEKVGSEGTYFLAKIKIIGETSIDANFPKQRHMGFTMNLASKQRRRGFGSQPRMVRVAGIWEITPESVGQLEKDKVLGTKALTPEEAQSLKGGQTNRIYELGRHDYRDAVFDIEDSNFLPENYVLVQAYLMPTVRNWKPIENLYRLRTDADDERIFAEFGQLAILNENNSAFWQNFKQELNQYKQNPEAISRLIRSRLAKEKKATLLSYRGKFLLSGRDY